MISLALLQFNECKLTTEQCWLHDNEIFEVYLCKWIYKTKKPITSQINHIYFSQRSKENEFSIQITVVQTSYTHILVDRNIKGVEKDPLAAIMSIQPDPPCEYYHQHHGPEFAWPPLWEAQLGQKLAAHILHLLCAPMDYVPFVGKRLSGGEKKTFNVIQYSYFIA